MRLTLRRSSAARLAAAAVLLCVGAVTAGAQAVPHAAPPSARDELLMQFNSSAERFEALAAAMPADKFSWSPAPGVMTVAHVYAHVAHYNYAYLAQNLGVALPPGIGLDTLERVADKAQVVAMLASSAGYVRQAVGQMTDAQLAEPTELYGRTVPRWSVLLQLVSHMNEHLGQSIAYARMNGIVPPWSR